MTVELLFGFQTLENKKSYFVKLDNRAFRSIQYIFYINTYVSVKQKKQK